MHPSSSTISPHRSLSPASSPRLQEQAAADTHHAKLGGTDGQLSKWMEPAAAPTAAAPASASEEDHHKHATGTTMKHHDASLANHGKGHGHVGVVGEKEEHVLSLLQ